MKHRKDWSVWKAKREAELRQRREMQKIMDRLVEHWLEESLGNGSFLARIMSGKPMRLSGGEKMVVPIIYGKEDVR